MSLKTVALRSPSPHPLRALYKIREVPLLWAYCVITKGFHLLASLTRVHRIAPQTRKTRSGGGVEISAIRSGFPKTSVRLLEE